MNEMRYVEQLIANRATNFSGGFKCDNLIGGPVGKHSGVGNAS